MPHLNNIQKLRSDLQGLKETGNVVQLKALMAENNELLSRFPILVNDMESTMVLASSETDALMAQIQQISNVYDRYFTEGMFWVLLQKPSDALMALSKALDIRPNDPVACFYAARACVQKKLFKEAVHLFQAPQGNIIPESWLELARVANSCKQYELALSAFEKSFSALNDDESLLSLAVFLRDCIRTELQVDWGKVQRLRQVIDLIASSISGSEFAVHGLKADLLTITGEQEAAKAEYQKALSFEPDNISTKNNLACIEFLQGNFAAGYALNENRDVYNGKLLTSYDGIDAVPSWQGQNLNGKTLIIFDEQGLGDRVLHYRYLKDLVAQYELSDVVMIVQERLLNILNHSDFPKVRFITTTATKLQLKGFDFRCHLCDLARFFGPKSLADTQQLSEYLKADPKLVEHYKQKYHELFGDQLKIGINWKSSSLIAGRRKDLMLEELAELLRLKKVQWISVQYGEVEADIQKLNDLSGVDVFNDTSVDHHMDLDASFAQIESLDAVISISSATAHIAGALGVETYVLTPKSPLWHWQLVGKQSCWYRSVQLIRQETFNTWETELATVKSLLVAKGAVAPINVVSGGELKLLLSKSKFEDIVNLHEANTAQTFDREYALCVGEAYLNLDRIDECQRLVKPLLEANIDDQEALLIFAQMGKKREQFQNALLLLNKITSKKFLYFASLEKLACHIAEKQPVDVLLTEWHSILDRANSDHKYDLLIKFLMEQREWLQRHQHVDLNRLAFFETAVEVFDQKLGRRNPVAVYVLRADILSLKGEYKQAIRNLEQALKIRPELADALNLSLAYTFLAVGDFKKGFLNLSKRLELDQRLSNPTGLVYPDITYLQDGDLERPERFCLMVNGEQGLGDQVLNLHFLRKFQAKYPVDIVLRIHRKIEDLVRSGADQYFYLTNDEAPLPQDILDRVDRQMNLADITKYVIDSFYPYQAENNVLLPNPERVQYFKDKYRQLFKGKTLVGISWRSASVTWGGSKDLDLEDFMPIFENPSVQCISIQYANIVQEVQSFNERHSSQLFIDDEVDATDDLDTLVAQIMALDHVVTVSNVNAHLAGSVGVKTDVVLKKMSLWHWHTETEHSLWYPSIRLNRQDNFDDYRAIFETINQRLSAKTTHE